MCVCVSLSLWYLLGHFFGLRGLAMAGKCIPITRGGGIYQDNMNEALDVLGRGGWVCSLSLSSPLSIPFDPPPAM